MRMNSKLQIVSLVLISTFLGACSKPITLKSAKVNLARVESTVTTVSSGTVEANQMANLAFGGTGRVEKILVKLGDRVKAGQAIAWQENADTKAALDNSKRDLETSKKLFSEGLISKAALDESQRLFESAKSNHDRTVLRAPFDGMISLLNLQLGESPNSALNTTKVAAQVVDLQPRVIKGNIDELDLSKVKILAKARVRIQSIRQQAFDAIVTKVVPYISTSKEQERTAQIELKLKDEKSLMPAGASADIEIIVEEKEKALALPSRAILGTKGKRYVYLVKDGRLSRKEVAVGIGNYETLEITSGLSAGDEVALPSESIELNEGIKVKTEPIQWP